MKESILKTAIVLMALALWNPTWALADSDIDFEDGVLYIQTEDNDDLILLAPDGDKLEVHIFELESSTLSDLHSISLSLRIADSDPDDIEDLWDDSIVDDRDYRRDFDDIEMVVINSGSGDDGIYFDDRYFDMPPMRVLVSTGSGNDFVNCTGEHAFNTYGEDGDDKVQLFNSLRSYISGGNGDDFLGLSSTNDFVIHCGSGDDTILSGGSGRIYAWGESGDDEMYGGSGNDRMYGGDGHDIIDGLDGDDKLYGGDGVDILVGGSGNDFLEGGYDGYVDYLSGSEGTDTAVTKYYRFVGGRFGGKKLIETLEEEDFDSIEVQSSVKK